MIEPIKMTCPYCWERFDTTVDCSGGSAQYVEDCPVCCQPIFVDLRISPDGSVDRIDVRRENE